VLATAAKSSETTHIRGRDGLRRHQLGKDPVLARHPFALLVIVLVARPTEAVDYSNEQAPDAFSSTLGASFSESDVWGDGDEFGGGHFCPFRLTDRYRRWYFQAEALALQRMSGPNRPLAIAAGSGVIVLETNDLDSGFRVGSRLLVGHRFGADRGWELSYFGLQEWNASAAAERFNNLDIVGSLNFAEDYHGADRIAFQHAAWLHNGEANLIRDGEFGSALAGVRYLHLNEKAALTATDSDSGTSDWIARSQSDLVGAQLGVRNGRFRDRWGWELTAKAGLYCSVTHQQQTMRDNDNTLILSQSSTRAFSGAFIGDINFVCFRQLGEVWSFRAGTYAMCVEGLALAPDQLDFNHLALNNQGVSRGDFFDLFVHGFSLGLEARW
jgi:hypothetical protein